MPPTGLPARKRFSADINDPPAVAQALHGRKFDVVVNWIAFTPGDIERDLELFRGRTRQYIFISSASAYQKPATDYLITESTPLANPHWDYSRNKIACEERLLKAYREEGFPITIVRPSLTYGETLIPLVINSWAAFLHGGRPDAEGPEGDRSGRWLIALGDHARQRFCQRVCRVAGARTVDRPCVSHHHRRSLELGPALSHRGGGGRR